MADVTSDAGAGKAAVGVTSAVDDGLVAELVARAQAGGVKLTGDGGLLQQYWSPPWRAGSPITWGTSPVSGPRAAATTTEMGTAPRR